MRAPALRFKQQLKRIPPHLLYLLTKIGMKVSPFLTVREKGAPPDFDPTTSPYRLGFESSANIDEILEIEPGSNRDEVSRWFDEGKLCFGVRDGSRLIAKMWCDLEALNHPPAYRLLDSDEAYLFAACVDNDYRGQSIAPLMRSACCVALCQMGRSRFCSFTDFYNLPARRFKRRMHAEDEALFVHMDLFGKWARTWRVKRYNQSQSDSDFCHFGGSL